MKFTVLTLFPELFDVYLSQKIIQRAKEKNIIDYEIINIREYSGNKHNQMDDIPFGGGAGMVLKPEAYWNFFSKRYSHNKSIENNVKESNCKITKEKIKYDNNFNTHSSKKSIDFSIKSKDEYDDIKNSDNGNNDIKDSNKKNNNTKECENIKKQYVIFMSPQGKPLTHKKVLELSEKDEIILISGRYEGLDQRVIDKFIDEEIRGAEPISNGNPRFWENILNQVLDILLK